MVKKMVLLFSFLTLFLLKPESVFSFDSFIKSDANPLVFTSSYPNWIEVNRFQPSIIYDNGVFRNWYTSVSYSEMKIAYSVSPDGKNWDRIKLLNLIPNHWQHDPTIVKTEFGYSLFFVDSELIDSSETNFKIYRIDSTDGINFDQTSLNKIIEPSNSKENVAISSPYVRYENGNFYLFYLCWGNQGFDICLATSQYSSNVWTRCQNSVLHNADAPSIFYKNNNYYLFYHDPVVGEIKFVSSGDKIGCDMNWSNNTTAVVRDRDYDFLFTASPSVLEKDNQVYLYYSGRNRNYIWTIDLAVSGTSPNPTKNPIVILPGLFGSWNKEAVLHNSQTEAKNWKLNPVIKEYNGLVKTFQNLGYQENSDLFILGYDWRKSLDNITFDIDEILKSKNIPNNKFSLIGHSLGGLVNRIYGQKYGLNNIDRIISVASPHQGTAQVYKTVEAGEIDRFDSFQWLAEKMILQLYKKGFKTDKETINQNLPILKDLFPAYTFLTNQQNLPIPIEQMELKNNYLTNYNQTVSNIFNVFQSIVGEKGNTLYGFQVKEPSLLESLNNLYPDGKPYKSLNENGDFVINSNSAKIDTDYKILNLDHGEIVYKKEGVKEILNSLNLPYTEDQIIEGSGTKIFPSLLFLILSPAEIEIQFNNQVFKENEGMVFIDDAQTGEYNLKVKGKEPGGNYTVLIGQIGKNQDKWHKIIGQINQNSPLSQIDSYQISFNSGNLLDYPINQNNFLSLYDLLKTRLTVVNQSENNHKINKAIGDLESAKINYLENNFEKNKFYLTKANQFLVSSLTKINENNVQEILDSIGQLENLYDLTTNINRPVPSKTNLTSELDKLNKALDIKTNNIAKKKNQNKDVSKGGYLLILVNEKINKFQESLATNNLNYAEIILNSASELLKTIH